MFYIMSSAPSGLLLVDHFTQDDVLCCSLSALQAEPTLLNTLYLEAIGNFQNMLSVFGTDG